MLVDKLMLYSAELVSVVFAVWLFFYYFDIFFIRKECKMFSAIGCAIFAAGQLEIISLAGISLFLNIIITIFTTLLSALVAYNGIFWSKCVFSIAFNAIWMLMETLCRYILMIYCERYAGSIFLGSIVSKTFFLILIWALKRVFTDDKIKGLPARYSALLVLIPLGSIYIMNNIFQLSYEVNNVNADFKSTVTAIILLFVNILIFYIYIKLAEDLQLRRMTSVYEQQLELCERHQQEREVSMLQLRDAKHNMKNNLVSIHAYAENGEYDKMINFIDELMEEGGINISAITNSGNIVIDSLFGYWHLAAEKHGIDFSVEISVPVEMPFKGADICLILGNLLENAVEAAQNADQKKYIKVSMKYDDKNNLRLFVMNSYSGNLMKTKDKRLKSTKPDSGNHGVGLPSVRRAAAKYQGQVIVDDSVPDRFLVKVLLYENYK